MSDVPVEDGMEVGVQSRWAPDALAGAALANQFAVVPSLNLSDGGSDGTVYVAFGHAQMPVAFRQDDIVAPTAEGGHPFVWAEVEKLAAIVMTRGRAQELHRILGDYLRDTEGRTPQ
ncbi:hypothetical protein [Rhodococcoides kroppenstedtii]|uniref:hypothetical protein n=1 Tax=Rhodococcoides kroppenstedtii TaxID=293050 RepID=UPI001BDEC150|nr:hypothetical protein [Rhodococcus kroppenstedtii]MBT1193815.1 hypothetical protein [Rhodococcus kroppenstedtii]